MGMRIIQCFIFLLGFLFFSGTFAKVSEDANFHDAEKKPSTHKREEQTLVSSQRMLFPTTELKPLDTMPQRDVDTPITTVPIINPSIPTTTTPTTTPVYNPTPTQTNPTTPVTTPVTTPYTTPTPTSVTTTPSTSGQIWCVASQSASETALQVALDYACGFGGADCSAIQQGGSCFNPDTVRDHASYAFNNYYQKSPIPTSCDFGGTAVITNTDPSTSTCQYPSTSTGASVLNTTNPTGSGSPVYGSSPPVYGSSPPFSTNDSSTPITMPLFFTLICLLISLASLHDYK